MKASGVLHFADFGRHVKKYFACNSAETTIRLSDCPKIFCYAVHSGMGKICHAERDEKGSGTEKTGQEPNR